MKKIDLIHTTLLIVAILTGYTALTYFLLLLSEVTFLSGPFSDLSMRFAYFAILTGLFSFACIILIRNSRRYASLILKDEPEGSWEDTARWNLDRRNLLLVLFIGIGLYTLIQAAAFLLYDGYHWFTTKVSGGFGMETPDSRKTSVALELLRLTIGAFLIYAAPNLTNFIENNIAIRLQEENPDRGEDSQST